jgi:hypothetical protein
MCFLTETLLLSVWIQMLETDVWNTQNHNVKINVDISV